MCVVGSYANNNVMFDVYTMLFFGFLGYILMRFGFSLPCFVIGFILGPMVETNYQRAMMFGQGDYSPFITRPVSAVFLTLALLSIFFSWRRERKLAQAARQAANDANQDLIEGNA